VEFSPPSLATADKAETYKLKLDELRAPEWWSDQMAADVAERMGRYIKTCIVSGDAEILIGGQFILASGVKIESAESCVITAMLGSSNVGTMWDSSKVVEMLDSSKVGTMLGSSKVGTMWGSSKVGEMRDSSKVGTMWDSSNVGEMENPSQAPKKS
jgi:hypothetical protein